MEHGANKSVPTIHYHDDHQEDVLDATKSVIEFVRESMATNWEVDLTDNARSGLCLILDACNNSLDAAMKIGRREKEQLHPRVSSLSVREDKPTIAKIS